MNATLLAAAEAEYARLYPRRNPDTLTAVLETFKIARRLARIDPTTGRPNWQATS